MPANPHLYADRVREGQIIAAIADDSTLAQRLYDQTGLNGTEFSDPVYGQWFDEARAGATILHRPAPAADDPFEAAAEIRRRHTVGRISGADRDLSNLYDRYIDGAVGDRDLEERAAQVHRAASVTDAAPQTPVRTMADLLADTLGDIDRRHAFRTMHGHSIFGAPSGFPLLDQRLYGFQAGTMTLIGAPPGAGKTTMITQSAEHAAGKGSAVLYCSFENDARSLTRKMLARRSGHSLYEIDGGLVDSDQLATAADDMQRILGGRLEIMECGGMTTLAEIAARMEQLHHSHPGEATPLLVIDYLQRLSMVEFSDMEERRGAVSKVSIHLSGLAKRLGVAIVAITSLNRAGYKDPELTSSKESGDLDFDADTVLMLKKLETDDDFERAKRERPRPPVGSTTTIEAHELRIVKNRHGPIGTVPLIFKPTEGRFEESILPPTEVSFGSRRVAGR